MNYGLQLTASGAMTSLYQMDVLSNNLANLDTPGFKPLMPATRQREHVRAEDALMNWPSDRMLEALGGGVLNAPNRLDLRQGAITSTNEALDVAIMGEGFFAVATRAPGGADEVRLTRNGRFAVVEDRLVQSTTGLAVLDQSQRPIRVPVGAAARIDSEGYVLVDGLRSQRLGLFTADPRSLAPTGEGLYEASGGGELAAAPDATRLVPSSIEASGVDAIATMMKISGASSRFNTHMSMIKQHDLMNERAITTLGRFA